MGTLTESLSSYGWDSFGMDILQGTASWGMTVGVNEYALYVNEQNNIALGNTKTNGTDCNEVVRTASGEKSTPTATMYIEREYGEADYVTRGKFRVVDDETGEVLMEGVTLEPGGEPTNESNMNRPVSEATYKTKKNVGYGGDTKPLIYNNDLSPTRGITIHLGGKYQQTLGCICIGTAYTDWGAANGGLGITRPWSIPELDLDMVLQGHIKNYGYNNFRVVISGSNLP